MADGVRLILVPYDSAFRDERMGRGPRALLATGIAARLERLGLVVETVEIEPESGFHTEVATAFDLQRGVRRAAETAAAAGRLPITLSGNCNTGVVGSLAAHGDEPVGLFWFDAHSDAETPDSTTSGFLDGTGFAMALGCCWSSMLGSVGSWSLDGRRAALVGAREISPSARNLLSEKGVAIVSPEAARAGDLQSAVAQLRSAGAQRVHVHVDLDVLDSESVGPANSYALPNGLTQEQLLGLLGEIAGSFEVASLSLASYDPQLDESGRVAAAGAAVIDLLARA